MTGIAQGTITILVRIGPSCALGAALVALSFSFQDGEMPWQDASGLLALAMFLYLVTAAWITFLDLNSARVGKKEGTDLEAKVKSKYELISALLKATAIVPLIFAVAISFRASHLQSEQPLLVSSTEDVFSRIKQVERKAAIAFQNDQALHKWLDTTGSHVLASLVVGDRKSANHAISSFNDFIGRDRRYLAAFGAEPISKFSAEAITNSLVEKFALRFRNLNDLAGILLFVAILTTASVAWGVDLGLKLSQAVTAYGYRMAAVFCDKLNGGEGGAR